MAYIYLIAFIIFLFSGCASSSASGAFSTSASERWSTVYGERKWDEEPVDAILYDDHYLVVATRNKDGFTDILFLNLDKNGNILYEKTYGEQWTKEIAYSAIGTDQKTCLVAGAIETITEPRKAWLMQVDLNGSKISEFVSSWKGGYTTFIDITHNNSGGYTAIGNAMDFKTEKRGVYLVRFDASLKPVEEKFVFIDSYDIYTNTVLTDKTGNIYITGGAKFRWTDRSGKTRISEDNEAFFLKINPSGKAVVWHTSFSDTESRAYDISPLNGNHFLQAGRVYVNRERGDDIFVNVIGPKVKKEIFDMDPSTDFGNWSEVSTQFFGGSMLDVIYDIEKNQNGFLLIGQTYSFGSGKSDVYILQLSSDLKKIWEKTYGGYSKDAAFKAKSTPDGGAIVLGTTRSFHSGNDLDIYIIKMDREGRTKRP